jgi:hypothetical protein
VDDAFDEVSDLRASMADDTAPRPTSWRGLRQCRTARPFTSTPVDQQTPCQCEKLNKMRAFRTLEPSRIPGN